MNVNWADLGTVFAATLVGAVLVVVMFSFGVLGLARRDRIREEGSGGSAVVPFAGSIVCFAVCVAIVAYGIYLIVAK
jgi:hypothetical protein